MYICIQVDIFWFKVLILRVMKVHIMGYESSYFGFGSQQVDVHARSKNTFIVL